MPFSSLSTLQRTLVALTALHLGLGPRARVLARHHVTEADLLHHHAEWEHLQAVRATELEIQRQLDRAV